MRLLAISLWKVEKPFLPSTKHHFWDCATAILRGAAHFLFITGSTLLATGHVRACWAPAPNHPCTARNRDQCLRRKSSCVRLYPPSTSWFRSARRHDVAPELRADRNKTRRVRKLVNAAPRWHVDGSGQGHHLILDAMVSDFLWSLAVVRLVGLLHDPISRAAQGLVSWSLLIGCNPWTAMRCLRSCQCHHV